MMGVEPSGCTQQRPAFNSIASGLRVDSTRDRTRKFFGKVVYIYAAAFMYISSLVHELRGSWESTRPPPVGLQASMTVLIATDPSPFDFSEGICS
jgi:hypothetical protein